MKTISLLSLLFALSSQANSIDMNKSSFQWKGTKVSGEHLGQIKLKEASIKKDKETIKSGKFVMDLNTISVTDLEGEWKQKLENHMKSPDFFNVEKHPTSTLVVKKVDAKNFYGELTIKNKTQPITIPYVKKGNQYSGVMKFDRTKFDMIYGSGNFFKNLGDKMINDEVTVSFNFVTK